MIAIISRLIVFLSAALLISALVIPRTPQSINDSCASDSNCASSCCAFNTGKCASALVAQLRFGGCGFGDRVSNRRVGQVDRPPPGAGTETSAGEKASAKKIAPPKKSKNKTKRPTNKKTKKPAESKGSAQPGGDTTQGISPPPGSGSSGGGGAGSDSSPSDRTNTSAPGGADSSGPIVTQTADSDANTTRTQAVATGVASKLKGSSKNVSAAKKLKKGPAKKPVSSKSAGRKGAGKPSAKKTAAKKGTTAGGKKN